MVEVTAARARYTHHTITLCPRRRCLTKGQTAMVEVTAARALCLEEYGDLKALGRIALRDGGRTVAVGVVTKLLA